ncbi:heterokaryon incompatibility protein [Xylariaceae sp. FL0255]|nr:heterokaryon incompatibility protein [Xylariaceae sp. FL0255]
MLHIFFNASMGGNSFFRSFFLLQPLNTVDTIESRYVEHLALSTSSFQTLALARKWIDDCKANHRQCNNSTEGNRRWCPTRLLDCGRLDDSTPRIRLIEPKDSSFHPEYMTLSHCWGVPSSLQLTTENYTRLADGVTLDELPKLYQDTIHVVRKLQIQHLWIDSLCILQQGDDGVDLKQELTRMSEIYSNSSCNISAADATDASQSLFRSKSPKMLFPDVVYLSIKDQSTPFLVSDLRFWEKDVSSSLINKRAWVLQERLLAPRVLHFGAQQLFWECCTKDAAEIYPDGLPTTFSLRGRFKNLSPNGLVGVEKILTKVPAYNVWAKIIQAYAPCDLTFSKDKLTALSAIASRMKLILDDEYVAGMWRRYLERELLWVKSFNRPLLTHAKSSSYTYRAPSWSWAAVDGEIIPGYLDLNLEDSEILINVEDIRLQYASDNRISDICGGWLKLRGVLKQLSLKPHVSCSSDHVDDWTMYMNGIQVSVSAESLGEEGSQPHIYLDRLRPPGFHNQDIKRTLYCMPARVRPGPEGSIYMLLLRLCDESKGIFRRIGVARGWGTEVKEKALGSGIHTGEEKFPCEKYENGQHTIVIV